MQLIEREEFLSQLKQQFQDIETGEGHCVFVTGDAGIGKTSLVKAFCKEQKGDAHIYQGACDALFSPRPLAPLYDIMWQVNKDFRPGSLNAEDRTELFAIFFRELSRRDGKILVVFEDVHWADEATLDFIKFLARRITHLPCLFILTYRDDESIAGNSIRNVLGQLPPDSFSRLQLTPLSREAVSKMALDKGYNGEDVYSISGGNPFYVNEILASYSPGVPDNIKDAILSVYDRQEQGTKNAWQICSVIPEGIEINRFAKIKSSWDEGMDHCFALKIIVVKNDRIIFKHELYRRTIEASLSPFKRIALNKKILELFLESFEAENEIERIVQYAKNANENKLVVKYAPLAAKQAAAVGSHIEAARLFFTAIEYCDGSDEQQLMKLYEAYAYECYLTGQVKEAIEYQGKVLKYCRRKKEDEKTGNSLRILSRLYWFDGNSEEAENYARQAIDILQQLPSSKAKAMAYSNMSQLKMFSEKNADCIEWGNKAIKIAREINDDETLCHALNNVGAAECKIEASKEIGKMHLQESLDLAMSHSFHEHVARAYSNIIYTLVESKEYDLAKEFLNQGVSYCEERDLDASKNYQLYLQSRILLETGNWNDAMAVAESLLQNIDQPGSIKIGCLTIISTINTRRGKPTALAELGEARRLAFNTKEYQRVIPAIIASLEYEWLTSSQIITKEELITSNALIQESENISLNSLVCFWLEKARGHKTNLKDIYEPFKMLTDGNIEDAAFFWEKQGCPFERAMALIEGDEENQKEAVAIFKQLGANAAADKATMKMRAAGIKNIPRGIRESTRNNPSQLTNRELDVLQLLQKGNHNRDIAKTLFISTKTADHHISNILFKLSVASRTQAVMEAMRLGILK